MELKGLIFEIGCEYTEYMIETNWTRSCTKENRQNRTVWSHCLLQVRVAISVSIVSAPLFLIQFNLDRLQIIVVAKKYIYVSQLLKEARDAITFLAYGYIPNLFS